jgi:hypothetical protein
MRWFMLSRGRRPSVVCAAAVTVSVLPGAALAGSSAYGQPGPTSIGNPKAIQLVTTADGNAVVRAHVAPRFGGKRFIVRINNVVVAQGRVGADGKILTEFAQRKAVARGATIKVSIGGSVVREIKRELERRSTRLVAPSAAGVDAGGNSAGRRVLLSQSRRERIVMAVGAAPPPSAVQPQGWPRRLCVRDKATSKRE